MPKVIKIGRPAVYLGRPLFKILCNLKDFGRGRIVYRTIDYTNYPECAPHFYRILYAQPEMDEETLFGRCITERVYKGIRYTEPHNISAFVDLPDFRLVPKDEEEEFCQWDKVENYDKVKHAPHLSEFMAMPPLLKEYLRRSRLRKGETPDEKDFLLPASEIYEGDHNVKKGDVESNWLGQFIQDSKYRTFADFDPEKVPGEWNYRRRTLQVGTQDWSGYVEGQGWEEQQQRDKDEEEAMAELGIKTVDRYDTKVIDAKRNLYIQTKSGKAE